MDHTLFALKGITAFIGILMLVFHMHQALPRIKSRAQAFRYITLLAFALAVFFASAEQLSAGIAWEARHTGVMVANVLLLLSMWYSIREEKPC